MKRLHVHVGVEDLDRSVAFYSTLFAAGPTVHKRDYAKWMLEDPRVNFAISSGNHAANGIEHLGIQVDSGEELGEVYGRLKAADRPVLEEGATTCCYARSEKRWIADPDGIVWETFLTSGEATVYGDSPALAALSENAAQDACCVPALPRGRLPQVSATIYHNPACATSRNTLALIRATGIEPEVILYLETPPRRAELVALIRRMGIAPRDLLREKGTPYAELGLDDPSRTDDQLIDAMMAHPVLINRPIVVGDRGVKLCRPSEAVLSVLDRQLTADFVKEDGEVVRADG